MTTPKTAVIIQSNYIPWKGYFEMLFRADVCILYDEVQYTKNDWRNRNRIKTAQGVQWLTIPVRVASLSQRICETEVSDPGWGERHWKTLKQSYGRARHFEACAEWLRPLYLEPPSRAPRLLSEINRRFLGAVCQQLSIRTPLRWSWELPGNEGERTARLVTLCQAVGATRYLSGPSAKSYLDEALFARAGLELAWMDYEGYPTYRQLYGDFVHEVSILDLLFNEGTASRGFVVREQGSL